MVYPPPNSNPMSRSSGDVENLGIQISYRTLSLHQTKHSYEEKKVLDKGTTDPAHAIRQIDVHRISLNDVYNRFSTSPTQGLEAAAVQRAARLGRNVISPPPTQYYKKVLNYVFGGFNFLMWVAFIVTILSYKPLGEPNPAVFNLGVAVLLLIVIIVSATFYAVVDFHASRIMKSIKNLIADHATVIRDGEQQTLPAADIVVGDLVVLQMGNRVPADIRIVQTSSDLKFDRSLLTGESDLVPGAVEPTSDNALETRNLALNSTFIVQGSCSGVVFAIGDRSVMGRIVAMSGERKFKLTTVQKEVWFFTKIISSVALSLFCSAMIIWAAWLRTAYPGYASASTAVINNLGCLTAFVPQGLPVCVALSLTIIAKRMARHNILVKNLATIETLGCTTVLCSDKTGTLTVGQMSVQNIAFLDEQHTVQDLATESGPTPPSAMKPLITIARLCNEAKFNDTDASLPIQQRTIKGNATDAAVLRFAESMSFPSLDLTPASIFADYRKVFEIPFNSRNKWMLSVVIETGTNKDSWMFVKGAPDVLFPSCTTVLQSDATVARLDYVAQRRFHDIQERWSSEGQRVLALCRRTLPAVKVDTSKLSANDIEELMYSEMNDLTLVGLIGIHDSPRYDVKNAIAVIRRAGIRVFMITGDFKLTAIAIARQVDIVTQERIESLADMRNSESAKKFVGVKSPQIKPLDSDPVRALALAGDDIDSLTSDDWDMIVGTYSEIVFARTTPEQKLNIVEQVKARGDNIVAVTGDGVNDAPALKASDVGVAMGSGSDVAKEAAAVILLNNDLSSIPVGVEMGRLVFDNLKKVILYLMPAGTYTQFMAVFSNIFLGMQLPLSAYLQVCFSITNDVVMSVSLMYEKAESDLMSRKPRNARTNRLTDWRFFFQIYLFMGLMMWPCAMSMWFLYMSKQGLKFYDVILVYNKWTDGYKGYSIETLNHFVSVGQCTYYVTMVIMQYGGLLAIRNRRVSILQSNPLWGPRRNLAVPLGMIGTVLIAVTNLYGPGLHKVFGTVPIPGVFWGLPFTFALGILTVDELRKLIVRTYPKSIVAKMAW